ncbi:MAG: SelB C-terminal domain-containing protein, partial [Cyanobacteria bacterium NC_groundwater_1444_Ag_S-0.65um_54_12]|nr:SelB C-terminal domain-containing protein [Cyanobacteria bacterium NC_groundwater_1444_Ag_S-0.65um_54_12]
GVMPQTREHLAILKLLRIERGVVVVTKADLVDPELHDLAIADIQEALTDTFLTNAPVITVSAISGAGLPELLREIDQQAVAGTGRDSSAPCRLPVDRAFSKQGFGTVVTGTLFSGTLCEGAVLEIVPGGHKARVRGLQVHGRKRDRVLAGQRVAINLAIPGQVDLTRGVWLLEPGLFAASRILDVYLEILTGMSPLIHQERVRVHHGTAEIMGRVALLEEDELPGGESGYAQLLLEAPLSADFGDRFVIRRYSPAQTIGGGQVLHPRSRRWRRRSAIALARLAAYREKRYAAALSATLRETGMSALSQSELMQQLPFSARTQVWQQLADDGILYRLADGYVHNETLVDIEKRIETLLKAYQAQHPHRLGLAREILQANLQITPAQLANILQNMGSRGAVALSGRLVCESGHSPTFEGSTGKTMESLLERLSATSLVDEAELVKDLPSEAEQIVSDWLESGRILRIGGGICVTPANLETIKRQLRCIFHSAPQQTAAQLRDALGTTRKFIIPLLEHLDDSGFTRRQGDRRSLAETHLASPP